MTIDIIHLPGWTSVRMSLVGDAYELSARYIVQPDACLKCGVSGLLYQHGTKVSTYRDFPLLGHPTRIMASVQRYRCQACGKTFLQPLTGVQEARRMTERCAQFIKEQCLLDTFVKIAGNIGCDDKTVRNLAAEHIAALDLRHQPPLPTWLGIDETHIDGKKRCVLTDIGERRPLDMLVDREKPTVTGWLLSRQGRSTVKCVVIDMFEPYRAVLRSVLPGVPIVIDKFHVLRLANYGMEQVRSRLQKAEKAKKVNERRDWVRSRSYLNKRYNKLTEEQARAVDMWLGSEPTLKIAHRMKEIVYSIYDLPKDHAVAAYDDLLRSVSTEIKTDFKPLLTAMKNWRSEILAYFDHPISNAYTEAVNGVAKAINRSGRGYSFEVLRARLLFGKAHPPKLSPAIVKEIPPTVTMQRRVSARARAELLQLSGGRCGSCRGVFEPRELEMHTVPALVPGEHFKAMMLCMNCHRRFHMARPALRSQTSTH